MYAAANNEAVRDLQRDPKQMLLRQMPRVEDVLGDFEVLGRPIKRSNDIWITSQPQKAGVVVIGDAAQSPCPSAGTGLDRLISDVEVLTACVPHWFASGRFDLEAISAFYDNPRKQAADRLALRLANYRRGLSTETTLPWRLRRLRPLIVDAIRLNTERLRQFSAKC
jgi:2-polyprenyl-6-methoxyphenol hydroxylase-like FAD-dependent oxidoreductase